MNCECGCEQPIPDPWRHRPPYFLTGHIQRIECVCGCGGVIEWPYQPRAAKPRRLRGHITPALQAKHEASRRYERPLSDGLCQCGCGERTPLAKTHQPSRGVFKGLPVRYLSGHHLRGVKRGAGRYVNNFGYVMLRKPDHPDAVKYGGYVLEHRWVMEQQIGRPVEPDEAVHHINHDRADNRPDNLALLERSAHGTHHGRPRGIPVSAEHRAKLSAQMKRVWAERRARPPGRDTA